MRRFQWNALRAGDEVVFHDSTDAGMRLQSGCVALVDSGPGSYNIGIRVSGENGMTRIVRPPRLAVHLTPLDRTEPCWRCDAVAPTGPVTPRLQEPGPDTDDTALADVIDIRRGVAHP
jgi:hypothetical protein